MTSTVQAAAHPATATPADSGPTEAALAWAAKLVAFDTTSHNSNLAMIQSMADRLTASPR